MWQLTKSDIPCFRCFRLSWCPLTSSVVPWCRCWRRWRGQWSWARSSELSDMPGIPWLKRSVITASLRSLKSPKSTMLHCSLVNYALEWLKLNFQCFICWLKLREYKTELDLSLPSPLDTVGRWLLRAEEALADGDDGRQDHAVAAQEARKKHEQFKVRLITQRSHSDGIQMASVCNCRGDTFRWNAVLFQSTKKIYFWHGPVCSHVLKRCLATWRRSRCSRIWMSTEKWWFLLTNWKR